MQTAKISIDGKQLIVGTPYHEEFIYDLKQIVPKVNRKYDPDSKYWIINDLSLGDDIVELIKEYFNDVEDLR